MRDDPSPSCDTVLSFDALYLCFVGSSNRPWDLVDVLIRIIAYL
jgi:hypothetical protein